MPSPIEVFKNPEAFWQLITTRNDNEFENQFFERKELGIRKATIREKIISSVSAFANSNKEGGLLILGISSNGSIKGLKGFSEDGINDITDLNRHLRHHQALINEFSCINDKNELDNILLIYSPYVENLICETLSNPSEAYIRQGKQNIKINDGLRETLKSQKRITDFEKAICCKYSEADLDNEIFDQFVKSYSPTSTKSKLEVLYDIGALTREGSEFYLNNAGCLFFSTNPQRELTYSYIRLLRFGVESSDFKNRGTSNLDKKFDGPIAKQILKIRSFFKESGFFKQYSRRNPDGGFLEEPELPFIAIDEAIVNSVAHRDYGIKIPIECIHYEDSFLVENPGHLEQRDFNVPPEFNLSDVSLSHMPRNPKLIEWLKVLKDEKGSSFIKATSEGTQTMDKEMKLLNLPSPRYHSNIKRTFLVLFNRHLEREALFKGLEKKDNHEKIVNLFQLKAVSHSGKEILFADLEIQNRDLLILLKDAIVARGWFIDRFSFGKLKAHRRGMEIKISHSINNYLRIYPTYIFQIRQFHKKVYMVVDYTISIKNINTLNRVNINLKTKDRRALVKTNKWFDCKVINSNEEVSKVYIYDLGEEISVHNSAIIPDLSIEEIKKNLPSNDLRNTLASEIKKASLSTSKNSSRERLEKIFSVVEELEYTAFPLKRQEIVIEILREPVDLEGESSFGLSHVSEPTVEFHGSHESTNIIEGITTFGAYNDINRQIEIVPICIRELKPHLEKLIDRLKVGKFKYKGSEKTFKTKFEYTSIITLEKYHQVYEECEKLLKRNNDWVGSVNKDRIFLIQSPKNLYSMDDEHSPYYLLKKLLFENGIPCQMIDDMTIINPDWKDLNLSLNLVSKCGITPWVLPNIIPDADFFIGLSYTQSHKDMKRRLMGYANVFSNYGRWEFYSGNTDVFSLEEKAKYFADLTKTTLSRLSLSDTPNIHFHFSAKFSKEDIDSILKAARSVRPNGVYTFVSINLNHSFRLFDNRLETDGSLERGSYIKLSNNQILLSTTGYNTYDKYLGTPKPIEATIRIIYPDNTIEQNPDLKSLANQLLSLTKLNWASTSSISSEPITTKFAGDIAYLNHAFMRLNGSFRLHKVLENTPWFI